VKFLAAIAVIVFSTNFASAESLSETLDNFGFFGRWAMDCSQPASAANNVRTARLSSTGDPIFSESLGGNEPNSYVILSAKRASADMIVLRTKLNGKTVQELTMRRHGEQIQTVNNRDMKTGKYVVRKTVIVGTSHETPWLTRCANQETPSGNEI
jgi:hypothetical protein